MVSRTIAARIDPGIGFYSLPHLEPRLFPLRVMSIELFLQHQTSTPKQVANPLLFLMRYFGDSLKVDFKDLVFVIIKFQWWVG
jgi:hypothetical protein